MKTGEAAPGSQLGNATLSQDHELQLNSSFTEIIGIDLDF